MLPSFYFSVLLIMCRITTCYWYFILFVMVLNQTKRPQNNKNLIKFRNLIYFTITKKKCCMKPFKTKNSIFRFERFHAVDKKHLPNFFLCLLTMLKVKKRQKRTNKKFVRCHLTSAKFFFMSSVNAQYEPK